MFALDPSSRAVLVALALTSFAGAFATTPIVARGEGGVLQAPPPVSPIPPRAPSFATVLPRRDPFAEAPRDAPNPVPAPAAQNAPAMPSIPAAIGPLPPNAGAAGTPLPPAASARVTAVVTGTHPFALVEEGGTTRIVTIGDALGSGRVDAIGADGVHLDGGATLAVAPRSGGR